MSSIPSKYADIFTPAKSQLVLEADIQAYPLVDTHIPQLLPSQKYDDGRSFELANLMQKKIPEVENSTGKVDDFQSLFATPANKEKEEFVMDFGIPSDLNSLFDLLPNSFDTPQIPTDMQSGVLDFWSTPSKDETLPSPVSEDGLSDPFVAGFEGEPSGELTARETILSDIFSELNGGESSPASSVQSPTIGGEAMPSSAGSSSWDEQLQELFERTFDFTDENDFLLMPPAKRIHEEDPSHYPELPKDDTRWPPSAVMPSQPTSPLTTSQPSSPFTASHPNSPLTTSQPPIDKIGERGGTSKPKGPLIFGQHEDTIIHKLLTVQPSAMSKPTTRDKMVSMPVEEFNQMLEISQLSEIEIAFMKEWRRRGKNKTAAQVARKRKREEITELDVEVQGLRKQKAELQAKYDRIRSQIATLKERTVAAEDQFYRHYSKQSESAAVSRESHTILVAEDGELMLVPKINSQLLIFK